MKELLLNNWKPKVGSLLVAIAIWYLINGHLERVPKGRSNPRPVPTRPGKGAGEGSAASPSQFWPYRHSFPSIAGI